MLLFRDAGLFRALAVTLAGLVLAGIGSWTRPADPALFPPGSGDSGVEVWVIDNGFHTDLALPRGRLDEGPGALAQAVRGLPPGDWVHAGWGDASFYVETGPISERIPDGLRAFFRPGNPSVVMLDPQALHPDRAYRPGVAHRLVLSPAGFARLRARLEASLRTQDGAAVAGPASQVGDGRFFQSVETFWIGHLCNHWTAELLAAAGLPVRPARTFVSAEIVRMTRTAPGWTSAAAGPRPRAP